MNPVSLTDSYLNLLLSLPHLQPVTVLSVFFLTLARILPILSVTPFLGGKNLPRIVRMMFGIALVAIFLPQNILLVKGEIPYGLTFVGLMCKELIVGFTIGLIATAPFFFAQMAGSLIDHSRGSSALQVNDPTTQSQTGPIGILYNYMLIALFFSLGGPFIFFEGVADAYRLFPVDQWINPKIFNLNLPLWKQIFNFTQYTVNFSVQLAAPSLIGILMTDLFLGIANRLAPQVQIVFLGISLKSWVGIALMTAAWALIIKVMSNEAMNYFRGFKQLVQLVGNYLTT